MVNRSRVRIGWLGPSLPSSSHIQKFHGLVPEGIEVVHEQLVLHQGVMTDVKGKLDVIVAAAREFARAQQLEGLIFPGAPREVLNPGLFAALASTLNIPVTTALRASIEALRAFSVHKILLLTPFEPSLNELIRDFLAQFQITAVSPSETLRHYTEALTMTVEDVSNYAMRALTEQKNVEGIYFQGAVLDPIDCLDTMEKRLNLPVIASNPAMLWHMLSKVEKKHPRTG